MARDHPRGCGEHDTGGVQWTEREGSSPRMRGAQVLMLMPEGSAGIIPADAGSTTQMVITLGMQTDHPRGCGEHTAPDALSMSVPGSSPRMRGAPLYQQL